MKNHILIIIILASLLSACQQIVSPTPDLEGRINKIEYEMPVLSAKGLLSGETTTLTERMEHYNVPGVSIAVISNYEIEWAKGFGVADAKENNPVTLDTLFQAASISKPATAMAVLYFVEQGTLDLDQDVNDRLVSWQVPENDFITQEKVTLRRLLSHTAGLNEGSKFGYFQSEEIPTLLQVLDGKNPAHSPSWRVEDVPGTLWRYSNGGYVTVAQLLMDVTGKPFPEILQENEFNHLNMTASTFENPLPDEYRDIAASAHGKWLVYPEMGASGLWTTPTDLAILAKEIMLSSKVQSNKVLSKDMVDQMLTPQVEDVPLRAYNVSMIPVQKGEKGYVRENESTWCYCSPYHLHFKYPHVHIQTSIQDSARALDWLPYVTHSISSHLSIAESPATSTAYAVLYPDWPDACLDIGGIFARLRAKDRIPSNPVDGH